MMNIMMIFFTLIILIIMLITLNLLINMKMFKNREKKTPFECGFNPLTNARLPFSIQFFLLTLIFLIFDIEIIILIPLIPAMNLYISKFLIISFFIIIMTLILGIYMEWLEKSINWMN